MPRTKEQNLEIRENTKNSIQQSALKLFAIKGFHATTMSDIATAAGVSKGLAYNYFKSKQEIAEAILNSVHEMADVLYAPLAEIKDPYERLEKITDASFKWVFDNFEFWKLLILFWLQPEIIEKASKLTKMFFDEFVVELGKIFGEIGMSDPSAEARIYGALLDGIACDYIIDPKDYPLNDVLALFKKKYGKEALLRLKDI